MKDKKQMLAIMMSEKGEAKKGKKEYESRSEDKKDLKNRPSLKGLAKS